MTFRRSKSSYEHLDYDDLAARYATGDTYLQLARRVGLTSGPLKTWMQARGHVARPRGVQPGSDRTPRL